ncbi:MAG: adenosine deaminase [Bdellovibrionales bacterium]|nr:adenosine deaminase [Bdellovibrionales bacterium]
MKIEDLPKIELHRHLELCVRHSTIKELAPHIGVELKSETDFSNRFLILEPMTDLQAVLGKFQDTQKLWSRLDWIERLAFEAVEDAVNENIRVLELRYAPTFITQGHPDLTFEDVHKSIVKGISNAEKRYPIAVGLICIIQRTLPISVAQAVTEFALSHKETFVGLDLADNEEGFDSKPFAPLFLEAKKQGLGITVHSGEANVPNAPRYVKEAIEHLGADRIGHGVQIYRDQEIMKFVKDRNIALELCPTSNWLTQAVPNLASHPFRQLFDFGIKTTINSDDPGIFNTDLNQEYRILNSQHNLGEAEFHLCNEWAFEASFIPKEKKQSVWKG